MPAYTHRNQRRAKDQRKRRARAAYQRQLHYKRLQEDIRDHQA